MKRKPTTFLAVVRTYGNDQPLEINSDGEWLRQKYEEMTEDEARTLCEASPVIGEDPVCCVLIAFDPHGKVMSEQFVREW